MHILSCPVESAIRQWNSTEYLAENLQAGSPTPGMQLKSQGNAALTPVLPFIVGQHELTSIPAVPKPSLGLACSSLSSGFLRHPSPALNPNLITGLL